MTTEETTTEQTDEIEGVIHQPTLPTMELPDYHGRKPVGMKTALAGAGTRVTRPHTIGDRIVLVIEARVKSASHEDTDGYARRVLCDPEVAGYVNAHFVAWGGSVRAPDATLSVRRKPEL